MMRTILAILLLLWLVCLLCHIGGSLINMLLVIVVYMVVVDLLEGRTQKREIEEMGSEVVD